MTDTLFCSGFAGPETLFPGLSGRWRFAAPFLDGDEAAIVAFLRASPGRVLGGWSTGAHIILKHAPELLPRFERVVLLSPFLRFADCFPPRLTRAMAAGLARAPEETVRGFWTNCGIKGSPAWNPAWAAPLAAALNYLLSSEANPTPVAAGHVIVVSGETDRIVRPAAVDNVLAALPGATHVVHPGGHFPAVALLASLLWP
ncbi:alpha/beta fold hydrolase [Desulfovibrio sp. TomC]|uniref:alpha/beta fold hydrolase n=1 Tax=Desulfovibrio sp. TomC TaxID=1562888 RepID=UPI00057452E2|nr:alpha/beta hydrolase [Desulfovibrio sp. TomC]KHK02766.1 Biotin synthesis protein BioH [Desulfovibrio sp. TomC]